MPDQTTIDLDAIRQREQAATEGPWRAAWPNGLHPWEVCISADVPLVELAHGDQGIADAEFIAAAREDVPALLAEVDRLTFQLEQTQVDATAYRDLADALQATMTDPDRWDGDEAEIAIMIRYVQHLAAERDQLVLELGNARGIAQANQRQVATLGEILDAVQAIAVDLRTPRYPGQVIEAIADRLDQALTGGTAPVPGSSRRAQEPAVRLTATKIRAAIRDGLMAYPNSLSEGMDEAAVAVARLLDQAGESALGDVGKCPQCGKQSRSHRRGCSWCGFGRPASESVDESLAWLRGLTARYGTPTVDQMPTSTGWMWGNCGVWVSWSGSSGSVVAWQFGREAKVMLTVEPTAADISGVVALAGLYDNPDGAR